MSQAAPRFSLRGFDHSQAVSIILTTHQGTFGLEASPSLVSPSAHQDEPVFRAVREACLQMNFLPHDADCVASAWQKQSERDACFDTAQWPMLPADFGVRSFPRSEGFAPCPKQLGLYAVLPDAAWVGRMARAGVPTVQLRFKSDDPEAIRKEVKAAVKAIEGTGALLFINDHWRAAMAAGAYGVHLGQEDLDTADLAAIRQAGLRLGLSTHGYAEMLRADRHTPSYIALGAVYPTTLKRMATAAQGPGRLRAYAGTLRDYPLVAIGGVDAARLPEVMASGVGSVAVVRALVAATNPEQEARQLKEEISMLTKQNSKKDTL
jgi:thiamine-phosphate pyrophosphorylase